MSLVPNPLSIQHCKKAGTASPLSRTLEYAVPYSFPPFLPPAELVRQDRHPPLLSLAEQVGEQLHLPGATSHARKNSEIIVSPTRSSLQSSPPPLLGRYLPSQHAEELLVKVIRKLILQMNYRSLFLPRFLGRFFAAPCGQQTLHYIICDI